MVISWVINSTPRIPFIFFNTKSESWPKRWWYKSKRQGVMTPVFKSLWLLSPEVACNASYLLFNLDSWGRDAHWHTALWKKNIQSPGYIEWGSGLARKWDCVRMKRLQPWTQKIAFRTGRWRTTFTLSNGTASTTTTKWHWGHYPHSFCSQVEWVMWHKWLMGCRPV